MPQGNPLSRRRYIFKISLSILILAFLFLLNGELVRRNETARHFDTAYVAKNCDGIPSEHLATITKHITYDRDVGGAEYIYDYTPGEFSDRDFVAAHRSIWSEYFCLPSFGCIFPPELTSSCQKATGGYND